MHTDVQRKRSTLKKEMDNFTLQLLYLWRKSPGNLNR